MEITKTQKIITTIILLFMPLSMYVTPIKGITIGDVVLLLALILAIISNKSTRDKKNRIVLPLIVYIIFIFTITLIQWSIKPIDISSEALSTLRYVFYIFSVAIIAKDFFNMEFCYKIYKKLAIIFAIYTTIQYLSYHIFKILLPANIIPFLEATSEVTKLYTSTYLNYYNSGLILFRPYSVFIEPSYYSIYQIPFLYMILNNYQEKHRKLIAAFIFLTFLLAGSTTGIVLGIICWIKPFIKEILSKKNFKFILTIIIILPFFFKFIGTETMQNSLNRIISNDGNFGSSVTGRFSGISQSFEDMSINQKIIGNGIGNNTLFLPSYQLIYYFFGYVGVIFISCLFLFSYKNLNKFGRKIMLLLLISMFGTASLFNITSVLYLTIIFSNCKKNIW